MVFFIIYTCQDEVEHYYSDPVGPLYMAPINTPRMSRVNNIVRAEIIATQEQVMALNTQVSRRMADIYFKRKTNTNLVV